MSATSDMAGCSSGVAKVFVRVQEGDDTFYLFSRKCDAVPDKHGRLELLGGNLDDEAPLAGAIRELQEEEPSGLLAGKLTAQRLVDRVVIENLEHFVFLISISRAEYTGLRHNPAESLGFELISEASLKEGKPPASFTRKTELIFRALSAPP